MAALDIARRMYAAIGPLSMLAMTRRYAQNMMEMAALVLMIKWSAFLEPGSAAVFAATVLSTKHAMVLMDTPCPLVQRYAFPQRLFLRIHCFLFSTHLTLNKPQIADGGCPCPDGQKKCGAGKFD